MQSNMQKSEIISKRKEQSRIDKDSDCSQTAEGVGSVDGNTVLPSKEQEIFDISSGDYKSAQDEEESSGQDSSDDETGDTSKPPGENADRTIDPDHLLPFHHGWKREVVMKILNKNSATQYDIFYLPPVDSPYRTRESKRKRKFPES